MENIKKREGKYKEETRRSLVKESAWKKIEGIGGRAEEEGGGKGKNRRWKT